MKHYFLTAAFAACLFFQQDANAQWTTSGSDIYNSNAGNVGIGTTSPAEKLTLEGNLKFGTNYAADRKIEWFTSSFGSGFGHKIYNADPGGNTQLRIAGRHNSASWTDMLTVTSLGNVGIGTTNPTEKLTLEGNLKFATSYAADRAIEWVTSSYGSGFGHKIYNADPGGNTQLRIAGRHNAAGWTDILTVTSDAKVGIGTSSPNALLHVKGATIIGDLRITSGSHTNFKLAVDGKLVTKEIYVTLTGWADYVFNKNYQLRSLEEVEAFVTKNQHLPGIPAAKSIEAEGLNMGEMQKQQMEKIEELYLYIIEMHKEMDALKKKLQ